MPTKRPCLLVTETDELAVARDEAAVRWPGLSRSRLLARLAAEGRLTAQAAAERRVAGVRQRPGALAGAWPADARDRPEPRRRPASAGNRRSGGCGRPGP